MSETTHLPSVNRISILAPIDWLAGGLADFLKIPVPCLIYGALLMLASVGLSGMLVATGASIWIVVLAGGFMLVGPMIGMGLYRAAQMLERGKEPGLMDLLFVRSAFRQDLVFLGLALLMIYFIWFEVGHILYGLSTYQLHTNPFDILSFMLTEPAGIRLTFIGSAIGGVIAFIAYALVVISAPMLLNEDTDVFIATVTSVRSVVTNFLPMLLWAAIIAGLTLIGILTFFVGLIVIFPVIGLASWRAYRQLIQS